MLRTTAWRQTVVTVVSVTSANWLALVTLVSQAEASAHSRTQHVAAIEVAVLLCESLLAAVVLLALRRITIPTHRMEWNETKSVLQQMSAQIIHPRYVVLLGRI